ncbi:MAG: endopeptidase La [Myxococcota bacterium]
MSEEHLDLEEVPAAEDSTPGEERLPSELPVLAVRNTVLFPSIITPMMAATARARTLVDDALAGDRLLVVITARDPEVEEPGPDDLYTVGTAVRILRMAKTKEGVLRLLVQGLQRVRVVEFVSLEPYLVGRVEALQVAVTPGVDLEALLRNARSQFLQLTEGSSSIADTLRQMVATVEDPSVASDLVGANLGLSLPECQELLEETDVQKRLERLSVHLARELEVQRLESEIREQVQAELSKSQREYVLREQARAIRRQLGEAESPEEQVEELRARLEEAKLPEQAREQADRELSRLAALPPGAAEGGTIRNYLEWIADLPWGKETEDTLEVQRAREILDEDHYDLEKVKERILEYIAVLKIKRDMRGPILCFVGPPGTGKTSLGRSIARAIGRNFARIALGGVRDEAEIRGHRRTYVGSLPGRVLQTLKRAGTCNPVLMLDELDKLGTDWRGDPASALLEVLDPEQNFAFSDHYLEVPFDLSKVLFIATANLLERIPPALRDRMEVLELPGYTEEEKLEIAKRYLLPRQLERNGMTEHAPVMPDETLLRVIRGYTREAGLRNLERELGKISRKLARRWVEEEKVPERIEPDDLTTLLEAVRYEPEVVGRVQIPGVAVGLGVTEAGGEILFVEATRMPGKGRLKITGSLGDVMRESVQAAFSVVRSRAEALRIDSEVFSRDDFHVHVPAGSTPKDGPSAGVAIVTALVGLLLDRSVPPNVAMTGEITLRGRVLPVGGIKEKVLAAKRAQTTRVLLPARNEKDLVEIPEAQLAGLEIEHVEDVEQLLRLVFGEKVIE